MDKLISGDIYMKLKMKLKKITSSVLILVVIFAVLTLVSCSNEKNNSKQKNDNNIMLINSIENFKTDLIDLMIQVDLIPYYEKQIDEKKKKEASAKANQQKGTSQQSGNSSGQSSGGQQEEFKPKPVTEKDTLLLDLLKEERQDKIEEKPEKNIPEDITFIWDKINEVVDELHIKWNDLKPELKNKKVSAATIKEFDKTINTLKISSSENNYLKTIMLANRLTSYFSKFIKDLKADSMAAVYSIKYNTRQIILNAANDDYKSADNNMNNINKEAEILIKKLKEKDSKDLTDKLLLSISDMENAVSLKDINVIKIRGRIVIKNINSIEDKL